MKTEELEVGKIVTYIPSHLGRGAIVHEDTEVGRITSWNDRFVFVDYGTGNSKATREENLVGGVVIDLTIEEIGWSVKCSFNNGTNVFEQGDTIPELQNNLLKALEFTLGYEVYPMDLNILEK